MKYINGIKIKSKTKKHTFVQRKTVERKRTRLPDKIRTHLELADETIAQKNSVKDTSVQFTPATLSEIVDESKEHWNASLRERARNRREPGVIKPQADTPLKIPGIR